MQVTIVILHFLGKKLTDFCLGSIRKLTADGFKIRTVVVNNNPEENLGGLEKKFKGFVFLQAGENLGFTGGNNLGIKKALKEGADWIFLVNNDTVLGKNILLELIKETKLDKKIGILGPKIYFAPGFEYHRDCYRPNEKGKVIWYAGGIIDWRNVLVSHRGVDRVDQGQYDDPGETDFVSGCAMLIKRKVFDEIGLLDKEYFLYLEDADFCRRAKKAGFKIRYVPQARLWHANASSSEVGGDLQDYFLTRNRLLFGLRYAPMRAKIALVRESFRLWLNGRPWQKIAVKDFYLRKFGKGSWRG